MTTKQLTITVQSLVTSISIDPVNNRLTLSGAIQMVGGEGVAMPYTEDVTDLLDPAQIAAALLLVEGAQAWIDSKMP